MSSYLELCQKFRELVGISGSGPAAIASQVGMNKKITTWVADAEVEIQNRWADWDFLLVPKVALSATALTSTFTPSTLGVTDLSRWRKKYFVAAPGTDSYKRLSYDMDYYEYLNSEYYLSAATTGAIERVVIRPSDNAVIFCPAPATTTVVWASYYKTVTRLSVDASITVIPIKFESAILYRAKMFYAEHLEDISLYNSAQKDFEDIIVKLEADQAPSFRGMQSSYDEDYQDIVVM